MLKNYLTTAVRRLKRKPLYLFINVMGLALGMACCLLVGLYIQDELAYDSFHESGVVIFGNDDELWGRSIATPYPLGRVLEADLPDIVKTVRTRGGFAMDVKHESFSSKRAVLIADPSFFEVFSFSLIRGAPETVLDSPDAAVITRSTAAAYFGSEDAIGKTLTFERWGQVNTVTVRGVADDVPTRSTIQFDMVVSTAILPEQSRPENGWGMSAFKTYGLLADGASVDAVQSKIPGILETHIEEREPPTIFALPLSSYYLSDLYSTSGFRGQLRYLYIFGSIALFVLLSAAINYVNLVTAQAAERMREIGVRKTLGAGRGQLMRQFLGESVMVAGLAFAVALALASLALPVVNTLFEKELALNAGIFGLVMVLVGLSILVVGVGAGAYPAFVLSRFRPNQVLRGNGGHAGPGGSSLRQSLVVAQFAVSVFLIVGTAVVYQQLQFVQEKNLGFEGEQVVAIDLPPGDRVWGMRSDLVDRAAAHAGVLSATVSDALPSGYRIRLADKPQSWSAQARTELPEGESVSLAPAVVDAGYVETLGLNVIAGRAFSEERDAETTSAYVLNETAARLLGWTPEEAVGMPFTSDALEGEVIGVVEDFHIESLHEEISGVFLQQHYAEGWAGAPRLIARLAPGAATAALDHLRREMQRLSPDDPFDYRFLDDVFHEMYVMEMKLGRIFTTFAALAILIACLGLFGLSSYAVEARTKEIGIRKVLGATASGIAASISTDFLRLVLIGFVVASPLAYLAMQRWLDDFAYRIEIPVWSFVLAGAASLLIALLSVGYQAISAALRNPVESLRYE